MGYYQQMKLILSSIAIKTDASKIKFRAEAEGVNFYHPDSDTVLISINETTTLKKI
jgi:glycine dehydrogenase